MFKTLIEPAQLAALLDTDDVVLFDCGFELGNPDAGYAAFVESHLPGARYLHLDRDLAAPPGGDNGRHPLPDPAAFAGALASYGESDLTCYRAEHPRELAERQEQSWDELLGWARRHFDVDFSTTCGLTHVTQPTATVERLSHALATLGPFRLAGLSPLVTIGGSLVAALGILEGAFVPAQAWDAVSLDERWQLEQWGSDAEAEVAFENRRRDFFAAARFLELLDG